MRYRATFLAGAAVGYVLGSRAGRERYEQIRRLWRQVAQNPTVQETAGVIRAQAGELAGSARDSINGRLPERWRRDSRREPRQDPRSRPTTAHRAGESTPAHRSY